MNAHRVLLVTLGVLLAVAGIIAATLGYTNPGLVSSALGIGPCCPDGVAACCPGDGQQCCPQDAEQCCPACCPEESGVQHTQEVENGN